MRIRGRLWAWGLAGLLAAGVVAGSGAADADAPVTRQAWSTASTTGVATFVPADDTVYVASTLGTETARSFVQLDMRDAGDDVSTLTLEMAEGSDVVLPENARLAACLLTGEVVRNGQLSEDEAPGADCSVRVAGRRTAQGAWQFDLRLFVPRWEQGSPPGAVLLADVDEASGTFRTGFDTTRTAVRVETRQGPAPTDDPSPTVSTSLPLPRFVGRPPATTGDLAPGPAPGAGAAPATTAPRAPSRPTSSVPTAAELGDGVVNSPRTATVLGGFLLAAALLTAALPFASRRLPVLATGTAAAGRGVTVVPPVALPRHVRGVAVAAAAAAFVFVPTTLSEATAFKVGALVIFAVAAMGLHVLVNWAGELSLAHAGVAGIPAFFLANVSVHQRISPLLLLPAAVLLGAAIGAVIAVPALRARGLYVAVVTLVSALAIDRFFFTRGWVVGDGSVGVSTPTLGPFTFEDSRSLYPVVAVIFLGVVAAMRALHRSKLTRALLWVKADRDAAAAFGVPVDRYRVLAYAVAGGMAGLAGGLTPIWSDLVVAGNFTTSRSFGYLVVVVLAGGGSAAGGVIAATGLIEGVPLFVRSAGALAAYGGPLFFVYVLTRSPEGLTGIWRQLMQRLRVVDEDTPAPDGTAAATATGPRDGRARPAAWSWTLVAGIIAIATGFLAIALAWYHSGNTDEVWVQMQELISGGVGGFGLIVVGVGLVLRDAIQRVQTQLAAAAVVPAAAAAAAAAADETPAGTDDRLVSAAR